MRGFKKRDEFRPAEFVVYVEFPYEGKFYVSRVNGAHSLADARREIEKDRAAIKKTYGGLIDATDTRGRVYSIYRADWEKVG